MAKKRKPGRPGANPADISDDTAPGEKKSPGRQDRLVQELRGNLGKRRVQTNARRSQSSQRGK